MIRDGGFSIYEYALGIIFYREEGVPFCHCKERSDFALFVIASLNAGGVQAWQSIFFALLKDEIATGSPTESPRNDKEVGKRQDCHARLWRARNDREGGQKRDCHARLWRARNDRGVRLQ